MRKITIVLFLLMSVACKAQTFVPVDTDSVCVQEFHDGLLWIYQKSGDYIVGVTCNKVKDDYGKYYQVGIYLYNLNDKSFTFFPDSVRATLWDSDGDHVPLEVYTNDEFQAKMKRRQAWDEALTGLALGLNAGLAGYNTTNSSAFTSYGYSLYNSTTTYDATAAAMANMALANELTTLAAVHASDLVVKRQGYLKTNTIHGGEAVAGFMNVKAKKGIQLIIWIPVNGHMFHFCWDMIKK